MKKPSEISDYYERLGLEEGASKEKIKSTYRNLAKKYHPDRNPENERASRLEFIAISQAYEKLILDKDSVEEIFGEEFYENIKSKKYSEKEEKINKVIDEVFDYFNEVLQGSYLDVLPEFKIYMKYFLKLFDFEFSSKSDGDSKENLVGFMKHLK